MGIFPVEFAFLLELLITEGVKVSQRDYVSRPKNNQLSPKVLIGLIVFLSLLLVGSLWFLKSSAPKETLPTPQPRVEQPKSALPSRPEETWSYIRELEQREVPIDQRNKTLNAEQEKRLKEADEQRRKQEAARLNNVEKKTQENVTISPQEADSTMVEEVTKSKEEIEAEQKEQRLAEQKAREKKLAEEKRKQAAELKKQQEEQAKAQATQQKKEPVKIVAAAAKPTDKVANQAGTFGLQCGTFKNKANAENMQARLAMAGFNARINSSANYNRVVIGPIGDRAATSRAQSNARSVTECVIISM